jgi:CubicO group peptidase (beta-lactamase class C family)
VGAALEKASGTTYTSAMSRRLFAPLGMARTFFDPTQVIADGDYTDGLSTNADGTPWDVAPDAYDCGWYRPAGYAFSNVEDYAKFLQFLYAGNRAVLSDLERLVMVTGKIDTYVFGDTTSYAYGVETRTGIELTSGYYPTRIITHEGAIAGYLAHFILAPETGFGMVILSNADGADFWNSIDLGFKSFSGLAPVAPPSSLGPDPTPPPGFAGTYVDTTGQLGTMIISDTKGALTISMPELDAAGVPYTATLQPSMEYDYLLTIEGEQLPLTFAPGRNDRHTWLLIGEAFLAERSAADGGL